MSGGSTDVTSSVNYGRVRDPPKTAFIVDMEGSRQNEGVARLFSSNIFSPYPNVQHDAKRESRSEQQIPSTTKHTHTRMAISNSTARRGLRRNQYTRTHLQPDDAVSKPSRNREKMHRSRSSFFHRRSLRPFLCIRAHFRLLNRPQP